MIYLFICVRNVVSAFCAAARGRIKLRPTIFRWPASFFHQSFFLLILANPGVLSNSRSFLRIRHARDELLLHDDHHEDGGNQREQGRRHDDLPLDQDVGARQHPVDADE